MTDAVTATGTTKAGEPWYRKISWGAIFAGAVIALGFQITLTILGVAIGFASIDPYGQQDPGGLAIGSIVWLVITGILSLFVGGWVAGRLSGDVMKLDRALNGLVVWGLVVLLSIYLMATTASTIIGGAFGLIGAGASAAAGAAPGLGQMLGNGESPLADVQSQAQQLIEQAQQASPQERQQIQQELQTILGAVNELITDGSISQQNRQQVADILSRRTDMSRQQADSAIGAWESRAQQARSEIQQRADQARAAAAGTAAGVFFILVLSAAAAALGASLAGNPNWNRP